MSMRLGGESGIDAVGDVCGHGLGSRQVAEQPADLFQGSEDIATGLTGVHVTADLGCSGFGKQILGEVGDLRDFRVLGRAGC
ncbi:hypothetical protein [Streptomyces drozdowiczii]|uniref:hypothetical protein n=1 Tax=Streptomyces drozdowiczii TaxID=202862 RepID=UPI0027E21AF7|nr:hypothetical protein [Streptomyces drozdowiczii]